MIAAASFLWVIATAYCDKTHLTSQLTTPRRGTIAVDPTVIPYNTRLFIPGYGFGRALDTGGSIVGRRIDVWMRSCTDALVWGRRRIRIERFA